MADREWSPPWPIRQFFRLSRYGFPRQVLMILAEGDKTIPEILQGFARFMHHFGHFGREEVVAGYTLETLSAAVQEVVEKLEREGLVVRRGDVYGLTPEGQARAEKYRREYQDLARLGERLLHPQTVSLVGLGVHLVLAVLKLTAGAISGSIGLISDGMDTAMDGLSSVLVFVGLRLSKEQVVNVVLVLLMLGVGAGVGYEAVRRVFEPFEPEVDLLTFAAAIVSGLVCLLLSAYQRFVGTRRGLLALISQSVDSRNHAIVAAGVTAGLVAALLRFPLLDTLVGLAVAALILKSGVELALETVRALRGEEVDFSRYELGFVEEYHRFQQRQLADWLLYIITEEGPLTRPALLARCQEALGDRDVPILRELGWGQEAELEERVIDALELLVRRGLVTDGEVLRATEKGRAEVSLEVWGVEKVKAYTRAMERVVRWVYTPFARQVVRSLPVVPQKPLVIDVGTGPGFLCIELGRLLPEATFIGVDPSPQAVETAQRNASLAGLERFEARRGQAERIPVDSGVADLVVSRASLCAWQDARQGLAEIHRVLKQGGYLALQDVNRDSPKWKRNLFGLLIVLTSGREMARQHLRAYETAFTLKEVVDMVEGLGFEVIEAKGGLDLFVLAAKR